MRREKIHALYAVGIAVVTPVLLWAAVLFAILQDGSLMVGAPVVAAFVTVWMARQPVNVFLMSSEAADGRVRMPEGITQFTPAYMAYYGHRLGWRSSMLVVMVFTLFGALLLGWVAFFAWALFDIAAHASD